MSCTSAAHWPSPAARGPPAPPAAPAPGPSRIGRSKACRVPAGAAEMREVAGSGRSWRLIPPVRWNLIALLAL